MLRLPLKFSETCLGLFCIGIAPPSLEVSSVTLYVGAMKLVALAKRVTKTEALEWVPVTIKGIESAF